MWSLLTNLKFSTVWCESSAIIINSYCLYWKHANKIGELPNVPHWNQPRLERGHLNTCVETGFAHDVMVRREQQIKRTSVETVFLPLTSHRLWSPEALYEIHCASITHTTGTLQSAINSPAVGTTWDGQQAPANNGIQQSLFDPCEPWRTLALLICFW